MLDRFNLSDKVLRYIDRAGAGSKGAHTVITNAAPFEGGEKLYAYALDTYTAESKFTLLEEMGYSVGAVRLDAGGDGYPQGTIIPGRFTKITPDATTVIGAYIIRLE